MKFPDNFCVLALGGNIGNTAMIFEHALQMLADNGFRTEKTSSFHKTMPEGCEEGAGEFLNGVLTGYWDGTAYELLDLCQFIEAMNGRPNEHPENHSRTLDIDIILFGNLSVLSERLTIPHPLAGKREFVMLPLTEIAPEIALFLRSSQK